MIQCWGGLARTGHLRTASGGKYYRLIYWLVLICSLFRATAVKHISYSSCFWPPFSTAVTSAVIHVLHPSAGKQRQTFITFQRVVAWCLRKHPLPLLLLHSHCTACKVARVFIFKDTAKLCKRSEGNIHHPRPVCWTSNALVVPSRARAMRIHIETSTAGQVASSKLWIGILSPGKCQACSSAFRWAKCVWSGQMPQVMYINPPLLLLCKEHVETLNISKAPTVHLAFRNAFHNTLLPLITSKKNYEWAQGAYIKCAVANTKQDFETQQAVPERKYKSLHFHHKFPISRKHMEKLRRTLLCLTQSEICEEISSLNLCIYTTNTG